MLCGDTFPERHRLQVMPSFRSYLLDRQKLDRWTRLESQPETKYHSRGSEGLGTVVISFRLTSHVIAENEAFYNGYLVVFRSYLSIIFFS